MSGNWQELARRASNGASAVLLWDESSNRVRVVLSDERLCHFVDFQVRLEAELRALHQPLSGVAADLAYGDRGETAA